MQTFYEKNIPLSPTNPLFFLFSRDEKPQCSPIPIKNGGSL
jgi:hypothetical protein